MRRRALCVHLAARELKVRVPSPLSLTGLVPPSGRQYPKVGPSGRALSNQEFNMRPSKRYIVNKRSSARSFRGQVSRTKVINLRQPMRGGIRL